MGRKKQHGHLHGQPEAFCRLFILAFSFLCGTVVGQVLSARLPAAVQEELRGYLSAFICLPDGAERSALSLFSTVLLYVRYPLAAVLLGFTSVGGLLLPVLTILFSAFFSFSIACFAQAFSGGGILLSLAVMGLRALITLPCYFTLALCAWEQASPLSTAAQGRQIWPRGRFWKRFGGAAALLVLGACLDFWLSPWLLRVLLPQILSG